MRRNMIDLEKKIAEFRESMERLVELAKPKMKAKVRRDLQSMLDAALRRAQFTCVKGGKTRKMEKVPYA